MLVAGVSGVVESFVVSVFVDGVVSPEVSVGVESELVESLGSVFSCFLESEGFCCGWFLQSADGLDAMYALIAPGTEF